MAAGNDIVLALEPVVKALEALKIAYEIGGSVASSACGVPRTTLDVDIVADLREEHVKPLVALLGVLYYVDEVAVGEAVGRKSSFNLIHLATMLKVDVFVLKSRAYDQKAFMRKQRYDLGEPPEAVSFYFAAPEDVVLNKLEWFRLGRELSERQWADVQGVLKVQMAMLDYDYLRYWAERLGVADLLNRALEEAQL